MKKPHRIFNKTPLLLVILCMTAIFSFGQTAITGKVTSDKGESLPGVNVIIKGTTQGTVTDVDGHYSLTASESNTLVFSFIGYITQETTVGTRSVIDIQLMPDAKTLNEVVVVGYGTQLRKDVTGAVASVNSKDFNAGNVVAPEQLIQGKVAGVNIVQNSGAPGAASTVRIRGTSSISAGNDPLYVVDGVPLQFGSGNTFVNSSVAGSSPFTSQAANPLSVLNPADIESIDILKDASATAIYGSRAANGVIVITTKSKSAGESVTYDTYVSNSSIRKTLPVLSADEYRKYATDNGLAFPDEGANTNWQNQIFRNAFSQNHNLSFGGGSGNTNFRASVGYSSQDGIIISSGIKKYTGRFNVNHKAMNGKLRLGSTITYGRTMEDNVPISSNINNEGGNILKDAIRWAPTLPVRKADGTFYQVGELRVNPVSWADLDDFRNTNYFLGSGNVSYDILESLTFRMNVGYTDEANERLLYTPASNPVGATDNGRGSISKTHNYSSLVEYTLNYNKDITPNSNISILGGYSYQRFVTENTFTEANQFISGAVEWNLMQSGKILNNTSYKSAYRLGSIFGRVNYKLKDRYLATFTLREDGSSRFGPNNRWGMFPSGSVAWRITEEDFLKPVAVISNLKLRVSYGVTGNQDIPNDLFRQQLSLVGSNSYSFGGTSIPSILPTNYANPDLKWEQTGQFDAGLDFGIFGDRISGSVDYYNKQTSNLLLEFNTAAPSVVLTQWANVGKVENKGIELTLNASIIRGGDWQWDASANFSKNVNKVLSLSNDQFSRPFIQTSPLSGVITPKDFSQIIKPGLPIGTFYGRKFTGLDENGLETYLDADGVAGADQVVIGNAQPKFTYGFTNNVRWKRFDASVTFRGVYGNDILNNTRAEFSYPNSTPGMNILKSALDRGVSRTQTAQFSSQWIEKGSYLRLDNITIGYSLNNISVLKKARIYVTAQNLFVITNYTGYDPEVRSNTNAAGVAPIGIDYLNYPRPRVFQLGGSFTF